MLKLTLFIYFKSHIQYQQYREMLTQMKCNIFPKNYACNIINVESI